VIVRSWVQILETTSCKNAGKGSVHKIESGQTLPQNLRKLRVHGCPLSDRTLPQTRCKRELCAPDCPFLSHLQVFPITIWGHIAMCKELRLIRRQREAERQFHTKDLTQEATRSSYEDCRGREFSPDPVVAVPVLLVASQAQHDTVPPPGTPSLLSRTTEFKAFSNKNGT
jgi:hypothetical protein